MGTLPRQGRARHDHPAAHGRDFLPLRRMAAEGPRTLVPGVALRALLRLRALSGKVWREVTCPVCKRKQHRRATTVHLCRYPERRRNHILVWRTYGGDLALGSREAQSG